MKEDNVDVAVDEQKDGSIYPNPCCRCGFCCLSEVCPAGITMYAIDKHSKCLALIFDGNEACCRIVRDRTTLGYSSVALFGIGAGCCIKARAYKDGVQYDFASLPPELKRIAAQQLRKTRSDL